MQLIEEKFFGRTPENETESDDSSDDDLTVEETGEESSEDSEVEKSVQKRSTVNRVRRSVQGLKFLARII